MTSQQALILGLLAATVGMFLWGRWRHDMVAVGALLVCVVAGLVPASEAFAGFGHPAVITVACVLVLSRGLQASGAVDVLTRQVLPTRAGPIVSIGLLAGLAAVLSGFMNNIGALALLMPVAIQLAGRLGLTPGKVLMPLAFGSILGGTTTLIGTPPNLVVSGFRQSQDGMSGFGMFDFAPVGIPLTLAGVVFIALLGWRLVPARKRSGAEGFETGAYLTEARVPAESAAAGMRLHEIEAAIEDADAQVVGLVRNEVRVIAPRASRTVRAGDILVIEADAGALPEVLARLGLRLEEDKPSKPAAETPPAQADAKPPDPEVAGATPDKPAREPDKAAPADEIVLMELAVLPSSDIANRTASDLMLRTRYGLNLLAVSRQGRRSMARLRSLRIRPGDVLLMQGPPEVLAEFVSATRCVPLASRDLRIPDAARAVKAAGIMLASVLVAALGLLPAAVSFAAGVLASMVLRTVPARSVYEAVDWPVVVLLAALLPVAGAMQTTGAADLIARVLLDSIAGGSPVLGLAVILVTTMLLTDLMNNAATAAVMAPIALGVALRLEVNPDTYLMAVALGASCSFLTPIGHQNNTLILGPAGFRFGDYWRMGLPLSLVVLAVGMPALLIVWPL